MLLIVERATNKVIERFEAWRSDLFEAVRRYCRVYGWKWDGDYEITTMGDMVVWVEDALKEA